MLLEKAFSTAISRSPFVLSLYVILLFGQWHSVTSSQEPPGSICNCQEAKVHESTLYLELILVTEIWYRCRSSVGKLTIRWVAQDQIGQRAQISSRFSGVYKRGWTIDTQPQTKHQPWASSWLQLLSSALSTVVSTFHNSVPQVSDLYGKQNATCDS